MRPFAFEDVESSGSRYVARARERLARQTQCEYTEPLREPTPASISREGPRSWWQLNQGKLRCNVLTIWFILRAPATPWHVRLTAGGVAAYVLSPLQLIPNFIPVIGLVDDLVVLALGLKMIRMLSARSLIEQARRRAEISLQRGENVRPSATRVTTACIALFWLILSVSLLLMLH